MTKLRWGTSYGRCSAAGEGFEDGSFRPNAEVSRAQVAVMIVRALGIKSREGSPGYADAGGGYRNGRISAVAAVQKEGLMSGREGGLFAPNEPMTRAEAAAWRYRSH